MRLDHEKNEYLEKLVAVATDWACTRVFLPVYIYSITSFYLHVAATADSFSSLGSR